jgi:hypothetical protein
MSGAFVHGGMSRERTVEGNHLPGGAGTLVGPEEMTGHPMVGGVLATKHRSTLLDPTDRTQDGQVGPRVRIRLAPAVSPVRT